MSLQAEAILALQDDQASQADHEAVFGLGRDLNSRMAQLPPLFEDSKVLEDSELVDSLSN